MGMLWEAVGVAVIVVLEAVGGHFIRLVAVGDGTLGINPFASLSWWVWFVAMAGVIIRGAGLMIIRYSCPTSN